FFLTRRFFWLPQCNRSACKNVILSSGKHFAFSELELREEISMKHICKSGGLPLVVALGLFLGGIGDVHAEYRTPSGYFAILNSASNYGNYNGWNYLRWNAVTSALPSARPYLVAGPVPLGVKVGLSDQCA